MNEVQHVTEVAKGISDLGLMAVTAAFFLLLSAAMMIAIFRWFKNIINDMIQEQKNGMKDLTEETRKQNDMLQDISEGLRTETQLRIRNLTGNSTCSARL
jgi:glycine cleavage system protein P-like pyridoxal-binding family